MLAGPPRGWEDRKKALRCLGNTADESGDATGLNHFLVWECSGETKLASRIES